jgi:hypothetical protein
MARTFPRRRCRICKGWFRPNPHVGEKQYACSKPECQLRRQIRNEEARLVRDPAYFRAPGRRAKLRQRPNNKTTNATTTATPSRPTETYEEVRDHVTHKVSTLELAEAQPFSGKVADHDVHKASRAQLAIIVGLVFQLSRHDVHKACDFDLIALHDRGRRLLAGGDRDGKTRPG